MYDLPYFKAEDLRGSLKNAIIAFEVEVREVENVFKLSQNRDVGSYENSIEKLHAHGGDARTIAEEMRKRKARLFEKR